MQKNSSASKFHQSASKFQQYKMKKSRIVESSTMRELMFSDLRGIQTHNLLIRSQMLYSVELGGQWKVGDSRGIQTHNLLIRSQMLYSVELGSHWSSYDASQRSLSGDSFLLSCRGTRIRTWDPLLPKQVR